ncbi:MAG: hypothetical protein LBC80_02465 [Treponema sp.]|jgi:hypothetical protein|nr:hypothetical protein [Treponema sp.]
MHVKNAHLKIIAAFLFLVLIPLGSVCAESIKWAAHGSIFYFPANNGVDSDPAPIIPSAGFSLARQMMQNLKLEFIQDIYFTNYEYCWERGYPMAASNQENRSAFVLGFVSGFHVTGIFPVGDVFLRIFGGPAVDLRIITVAFGLHPELDFAGDDRDARLQTDAIVKYFWGKGRWFLPTAGLGVDFPVNDKFLLGFDLRTWIPVYKLWTDDGTSAIDGWRFGVGFRITPRTSL